MGYNYNDFRLYSSKSFPDSTNFADTPDKLINFPECTEDAPCAKLQVTAGDATKTVYEAKTISFHAPSEHTVDGAQYDLELHFTHEYNGIDETTKAEIKTYAILVFFFDVQTKYEENAFLTSVFDAIASYDKPEDDPEPATTLSIKDFFGEAELTKFWTYDGSLTYPPCTEGVSWNIFKQVQSISPD